MTFIYIGLYIDFTLKSSNNSCHKLVFIVGLINSMIITIHQKMTKSCPFLMRGTTEYCYYRACLLGVYYWGQPLSSVTSYISAHSQLQFHRQKQTLGFRP